MVRCPRCGKAFTSESGVLRHMNQPLSACTTFTEELVTISDTLANFRARPRGDQTPPSSSHREPSESSSSSNDPNSPPLSPMDVDDQSNRAPSNTTCTNSTLPSPYIEVHPAAGKVLGHGRTFMDDFKADAYAEERTELPYYPFTSRDEWELASFLLRSSLSMKSIDAFLSLNMVCLKSSNLQYAGLIVFRYVNSTSPLSPRKISVIVQKCFLRAPNGSVSHGKQYTLPKTL